MVNVSNNIVRSFAFLERFPNLETLIARSCKIADISQLLSYCARGLKNLDLSNNLITDFKNLDHPYLETLILDGNPLKLFTELQLTLSLPSLRLVQFKPSLLNPILIAI